MNDNNCCEHYMRPVAREAEKEIYNLLMSDTRKQGFFGEALDEKSHIALQRAEVSEIIWRHWMDGERDHDAQFPSSQSVLSASEKRVKELEAALTDMLRIFGHENCGDECNLSEISKAARKLLEAPHEP